VRSDTANDVAAAAARKIVDDLFTHLLATETRTLLEGHVRRVVAAALDAYEEARPKGWPATFSSN
jgi:hypothetical protein